MNKIILNCRTIDEPYEWLAQQLHVEAHKDKPLRSAILSCPDNFIIEVHHRTDGMEKWPDFMIFLEELSQKNRFVYVIWGPKRVEELIARDQEKVVIEARS